MCNSFTTSNVVLSSCNDIPPSMIIALFLCYDDVECGVKVAVYAFLASRAKKALARVPTKLDKPGTNALDLMLISASSDAPIALRMGMNSGADCN